MMCIANHERPSAVMKELSTLILQRYESHSKIKDDCLLIKQCRGLRLRI